MAVNDYFSYNLPDGDIGGQYDPLTIHLYPNVATPIPTTNVYTLASLTGEFSSSDLEPTSKSILSQDYNFYATVDFYSVSGDLVQSFYKEIIPQLNSGTITIDNDTIANLLPLLGAGISTIKIQVKESEYFAQSPVINAPLEILPPEYTKFGQKNTKIDLIDPMINSWAEAFDGDDHMPFESNYPHLMGTLWIDADFWGTSEEKEQSIQDYIEINLMGTIEGEDGLPSTFPIREGIMLRPVNREGLITYTDRPLPHTKISKLIGMGEAYLTDLFQRSDRNTQMRPFINFKTFASKMQPALTRAFGEKIANDLIGDYLADEGSRFQILYSFYKILCDKTNTFYNFGDFSEILFGNPDKASVFLRTPTPAIRDLDQMWTLEYMVSKMKVNTRLGFNPSAETLSEIKNEVIGIIRKNFISQVSQGLPPEAVIMILESLKALSEVREHRVSFKELSLEIDKNENKLFLSRMFGSGRATPRAVTLRLLAVLTSEGVNPDHMAFQWAELYLNTRGLAHINFDYYLRELTTVVDHTPATTSQITQKNRLMAKSITWGLTAGRSWLTGEKMSYDQTILHHIRHDANPPITPFMVGLMRRCKILRL